MMCLNENTYKEVKLQMTGGVGVPAPFPTSGGPTKTVIKYYQPNLEGGQRLVIVTFSTRRDTE